MSSATSVNEALAGYAAGRVTAQQLVGVVATAYWSQEPGARNRELLRPIIEVIEKAHPGVVELTGSAERPGFAVRLAERPFPKRYEADLRQGVQALLGQGAGAKEGGAQHGAPLAGQPAGIWSRIIGAVRRLFTGST